MKISYFFKVVPFLFFIIIFCNGCWDKKEFNQLAIAQTIAVDYMEEQYRVTVQLVMPSASDEDVSGESMWLIHGKGASVAEAMEEISYTAPRELYMDHLDIVLLGEGVLQHNVGESLEYLLKEQVLRRRTDLLAVQGNAGDLLETKLKLADVDVYYLRNLLRDQRKWVKNGNTIINDYCLAMDSELKEGLIIPRIITKGEDALELNGAALLQGDKLLCWMDQLWMGSYRWITGGAQIYLLSENAYHDDVTVEVRKEKCKWELISEEPLKVRANLYGTLRIAENTMRIRGWTLEETKIFHEQIQQELEWMFAEQIQKDFVILQKNECDALRVGRWLYAYYPRLVKTAIWEKQFSEMELDITLNLDVKSYELK